MKKSAWIATAMAAVSAALVLAPIPSRGQSAEDAKKARGEAAKAKRIAENFKLNARTLTIFDRQGKVVTTVGERGMFNVPFFSPDGRRLAVVKNDQEKETNDLWVYDVATGQGIQITSSQRRERAQAPVWSPDGSQLAFVAVRSGNFGLYRKHANGQGPEELIYQLPGTGNPTDWSADGRYLTYTSSDLSGGTIFAVPLTGTGERKPIEIFHSQFQLQGGGISPDGRWVAYTSNETQRNEVYVRGFDPTAPGSGQSWRISREGGSFPYWRGDGKELYYLAPDQTAMAVEVRAGAAPQFGVPKVAFRPPGIFPGPASVSRDGERMVVSLGPNPLRQITVFDRQGKTVKTVGQPGLFIDPSVSPDGKRVVLTRTDPHTGNRDIWTFDLATGKGTPITDDLPADGNPIWSSDGKWIAYTSFRDNGRNNGIYRKAWDGSGQEELLFRTTPGAGMDLSDWSPDGKFLTFATGALSLVQLDPNEKALDRKAIEWMREEYDAFGGRFSPDMRLMAYEANPDINEIFDIFVRPFDAAKPDAPLGPAVQVSPADGFGVAGVIYWSQDGKELCYLTADWEVACAESTTAPGLKVGIPKVLFKLPARPQGDPDHWLSSRDGQRFVFAMPVTAGGSK
jgi:Tol biopolymer transport system component